MAYTAFIDESGDHGMQNIDPEPPMFALTAVVYRDGDYLAKIENVGRSKLKFWPHEGAVFHAYEIKKKLGHFSICTDRAVQERLREELCDMFKRSRAKVIAAVINKARHAAQYVDPIDPYQLTVQFVLERIFMMTGAGTKIVFEILGKGRKSDLGKLGSPSFGRRKS